MNDKTYYVCGICKEKQYRLPLNSMHKYPIHCGKDMIKVTFKFHREGNQKGNDND